VVAGGLFDAFQNPLQVFERGTAPGITRHGYLSKALGEGAKLSRKGDINATMKKHSLQSALWREIPRGGRNFGQSEDFGMPFGLGFPLLGKWANREEYAR
jgi:hypothetical protein